MDDHLKPVTTVRKVQANIAKFENLSLKDKQFSQPDKLRVQRPNSELPNPSKTPDTLAPPNDALMEVSTGQKTSNSGLRGHKKQNSAPFLKQTYLQSPAPSSLLDDAREILKSQPDYEDLSAVLQYLQYGITGKHGFNIRASSSQAAQILHVLVTVTIPDQWTNLSQLGLSKADSQLKQHLISCLTSVAGLGALLAEMKKLSMISPSSTHVTLGSIISVVSSILRTSNILSMFLRDICATTKDTVQRRVLSQELTSLVAGGKILVASAHAISTTNVLDDEEDEEAWLGNGGKYCKWLGRAIAAAATGLSPNETDSWAILGQVLKRGFSLGHRDLFVAEVYSNLLFRQKALWTTMNMLIQKIPRLEQTTFLDTMMLDVARKFLQPQPMKAKSTSSASASVISTAGSTSSTYESMPNVWNQPAIRGVAALVAGMVKGNPHFVDHLVDWLTKVNGESATLGLDGRRAIIAALAEYEEKLQTLLDKALQNFSDKLQIEHSPMLEQEATAQVVLLTIAYLNRLNPEHIKTLSKSSLFLHAVSNRLSASIPEARLLGMTVGVAVSRLVDQPGKLMQFDMDEMKTESAHRWFSLVHTEDKIGDVEDLTVIAAPFDHLIAVAPKAKRTPVHKSPPSQISKIIAIEEVSSESESEDELKSYQKPDDDPSDSDDDPTLLNRSKPTPPVYIIDLVKALRVIDKPDMVELALKTAPSLIRRKAGFGTELSESINDVASALINLQDGMSKDEAQQIRLQGLIACVVTMPETMGPWLASMYFEGDFSLAQRASILSTIGLGSREIAGHRDDTAISSLKDEFPSKRLPKHLAAIYTQIGNLAGQIEHATLQPMALAAADKITGPNILKVRTFSSRMDVEKKTQEKMRNRQIRIPRQLHQLLSESFYMPLCYRMSLLLSTRKSLNNAILFEPHIMRLFLQTLTILLATIGPHALQLQTLTRETLILLINLHIISALSLDPVILPALLQLLLTILDLNIEAGAVAEERLVTDFGTQIAELVSWAGGISNVISMPDNDATGPLPWTVLVAGCQVKWHEVGRKFQGRMVGLIGSDMDQF